MTKDDVLGLARLARVAITEQEAETFTNEIDAILAYVSVVQAVATDAPTHPTVGPVHNVFRTDEVTNADGEYTKALLEAMTQTSGRYLQVPKILNTDD